MEGGKKPGGAVLIYKMHWHVIFTHFPVAFFFLSSGFMIYHEFNPTPYFELVAYIILYTGMALLVPSVISGWLTWKYRYKSLKGKIFIYKISIAWAMLVISGIMLFIHAFLITRHAIWHWTYTIGIVMLLIGSITEGFYGGRLNHR